ncbi:recombinase family protein [Rufibacter latericius]|nr:recombinase family protein [Rufibacter latericius]
MNHKQKKRLAEKLSGSASTNTQNNAVVYTRVSSKSQQLENASLETQMKYCLKYAEQRGYNVLEFFGGTFESAKNDERKEFNRMISYVKKSKMKISFILVYTIDRFSRSGANAIYISKQLKELGISILAVSQPTDTTTASGVLHQNIQFIFSQYDNDLRSEKTIHGMREKLLRGEWSFPLPRGYYKDKNTGEIHINQVGDKIRFAFNLFDRGNTAMGVKKQLDRMGYPLDLRRWIEIFKNPLYAGIMVSKLLGYEPVNWKYVSITTKEIFQRVNLKMKGKTFLDYQREKVEDEYYAKGVLICICGSSFTAYEVKSKGLHYYICINPKCRTNISAKTIHEVMEKMLYTYTLSASERSYVNEQFRKIINDIEVSRERDRQKMLAQKLYLEEKIERIENKFLDDEVDIETYRKHKEKLSIEMGKILKDINRLGANTSNQCMYIDEFLEIASKTKNLWQIGDTNTKKGLLKLLFPRGIVYHKQTGENRTDHMNSVFCLSRTISDLYRGIKKEDSVRISELSSLVPRAGVEPAHP